MTSGEIKIARKGKPILIYILQKQIKPQSQKRPYQKEMTRKQKDQKKMINDAVYKFK